VNIVVKSVSTASASTSGTYYLCKNLSLLIDATYVLISTAFLESVTSVDFFVNY